MSCWPAECCLKVSSQAQVGNIVEKRKEIILLRPVSNIIALYAKIMGELHVDEAT